ncbi:RelA/SpoT family protein [Paenibacillus oryzisoli]|uniref:GTP pyrophosphokinase n=1 Tax=Paenibacillus oryzisoli TaxID=1850517 RepID=A0A198A8X5_9BACL|nr:bifunctional (p)ppGpp synthetase/guanosine-3',5'-bis(diphosphate) 3'-pyrophosphohydrolase [Paenibacillus oryzisoli]OAS17617.1 (p)ppGpp synthetase [Paenibacillus oryzisoli]
MGIEQLLEKAATYLKENDLQRIREAYEFADEAHHGQVRKSGEPYILHPLAVADILVNMQMDVTSVIAALLHDVVEDTTVSLETVLDKFGKTCAMLVDGLTKLERIKFKSKEEQQNENYRKMFVAMAQDIRVILIKLADRLHNMRTLKYQSEESQRRIAEETLEIFCPIAHRLGISTIKWEMEDIALRYLNPQQYYRIVNLMQKKRTEREQYIEDVIHSIKEKLDEMGIQGDISGRPKHLYSIYKKMSSRGKQFNEIYDLMALRVIVDGIKDCYASLGIIHTLWKPMPGRFKDYIAMPKPNMYQSLHTTVIGPKGEPLEVQIRTWEMHRTSEFGIAAHWAYKEGGTVVPSGTFEDKMSWFREILELQHETNDASEFMESMKMDFFSDLVFVFTPKGEVIELPAGAVPLDFAYRIHTEIGNRTIGAKVNSRIVPLDHKLKTGDIIEILTSKHSYGPSQDWIKIAQSSHARSKIKQWFKKEKREENVEKGKDMIERELKRLAIDPPTLMSDDKMLEAAKKFNFSDIEDMLSAVGFGGITAAQICTKLTEKMRKEAEEAQIIKLSSEVKEVKAPASAERKSRPTNGVRVKGVDNLLVRFARCCNPVPGDFIVGYITRGRGVSVHRSDCTNIPTSMGEEERVIEVDWAEAVESNFNVEIEITGHDRRGFLNEVLQAVSESKTMISAVSGRSDKNKMATIHMTILIKNIDHLQSVVEKIKRVKDIYSVQRIMQT